MGPAMAGSGRWIFSPGSVCVNGLGDAGADRPWFADDLLLSSLGVFIGVNHAGPRGLHRISVAGHPIGVLFIGSGTTARSPYARKVGSNVGRLFIWPAG